MHAGVAATDFTPKPGLILQGHLSKNPSHTVLYPLEARALVVRNDDTALCLITLDVIGVEIANTRRMRARIHDATKIPESNILLCASHTHCTPAMLKNLAMTPDPAWVARVEDAAVECAVAASKDLHPVTFGLGASSAHFNINRRPLPGQTQFSLNYGGVVDHRVRILRLDNAETSKPLAILFTFSCHPTTKVGSEGFISPDYPGIAQRIIEGDFRCRALFLPGTFGNIRPTVEGTFNSASKEQLEATGDRIAGAVVCANGYLKTMPHKKLIVNEAELNLPFAAPKPIEELQHMMQETSTPGLAVRADWARRTIEKIQSNSLPQGVTSIMSFAQIGPVALVTIPGEPVQEIGYAIEREIPPRNGAIDLWPIGYTNDQIGYLVTERHKEEGGYEPNAYTFYDRPANYDHEEHRILETARRLVWPP